MELEAFLLCECATQNHGKLNVLGAFDGIISKKVPFIFPACTIAARIRFFKIEQGEHKIRINFIDADGSSIGPKLEKAISIPIRENESSSVVNIILNIQRLKLNKYGEYSIDLAIDGRQEATLPLFLRETPNQPERN